MEAYPLEKSSVQGMLAPWLEPVISATWELEIGGLGRGQPG
jgi:hypothetical protein